MAVVKLASGGYVRLTTNTPPTDLEALLSEPVAMSPTDSRRFCDAQIGSALLLNPNLPPAECIQRVQAVFGNISLKQF